MSEGHNSGVDATKLKDFARRIASLESERAVLNEDIKSVKAEAKDAGFNTKALNTVLSLLKRTPEERATIDLYAGALNVFD